MVLFHRFPATGVGLGGYVSYRKSHLDGGHLVAHNTIATVLGEMGIVGGIAFLVFISGIFVNCSRTKRLAALGTGADVWIMRELAVACRNSIILILFLGMFGEIHGRAQLYWVAAFGVLAYTFARTASENCGASIAERLRDGTNSG